MRHRSAFAAVCLVVACDAAKSEDVDDLKSRVEALEQKHPTEDPVEQLQAKVDELSGQVGQANRDLVTAAEKIEASNTKIVELEASIAELQARAPVDGPDPPAEDSIGVPECDEYITKYRECIDDKMPQATRETALKALDASVDAWKQAAATPLGKEALAEACKTALEAVSKSCGF
jgi:chromosome segregation ATPase